ncbi:MAG: exo-alpha-sialidase, partial [Pyrinomonadaceae bacterium]
MQTKSTLLMVGTAKGLFILRESGGKWSLDGPHFPGLAVYSAFFDQRQGRNTMWAAPASWHFGAELCKSLDMGKTWDMPEKRRIKMPAATKKSLENIWQITAGGKDDTLYAGV